MYQSQGDSHFSSHMTGGHSASGHSSQQSSMPPPPARTNGMSNGRTSHDYMGVSVLMNLNSQNSQMSGIEDVFARTRRSTSNKGNSSAFASEGITVSSGPSAFSPTRSSSRSDSSPESGDDSNQSEKDSSPPDAIADCILPVYGIGV